MILLISVLAGLGVLALLVVFVWWAIFANVGDHLP